MNQMLTSIPHTINSRGGINRLRPLAYRSLIVTVAAGALLGSAYAPAFAVPGETATATTTVNVVVESAITITGLPVSFTLNGTPGATDTANVPYVVQTNNAAGYTVGVQSQAADLTPARVGNPDLIPIGTLEVSDVAGNFVPVNATAPVIIARKTTRSATAGGGDNLSANFQITIPNVTEDTYSANLDFIATTL